MSLDKLELHPEVSIASSFSGSQQDNGIGLNTIYFQTNCGDRTIIPNTGLGTSSLKLGEDPNNYRWLQLGGSRWGDWGICPENVSASNGTLCLIATTQKNTFTIGRIVYNSATYTFNASAKNSVVATLPTANGGKLKWATGLNTYFWSRFGYDRKEGV